MTRDKLIFLTSWVLKKNSGSPIQAVAEAVADRIEEELEFERGAINDGVRVFREEAASHGAPPLPVEAGVSRGDGLPEKRGSTLLAIPGDAEFEETQKRLETGQIAPVRLNRHGSGPKLADVPDQDLNNPSRQYWNTTWNESGLVNELHANTPEFIEFVPDGRDVAIKLTRNIECMQKIGARLTYSREEFNQPTGSSVNQGGGTLQPVSIDTPASEIFLLTDGHDLRIPQKMERLIESAKHMFAPREAKIWSTTPHRAGNMTIRGDEPHADDREGEPAETAANLGYRTSGIAQRPPDPRTGRAIPTTLNPNRTA